MCVTAVVNGRRDPNETGLAGWTIRLTSSSGTISSTVTDDFGRYSFMNLPAGTYTVTEVQQPAWEQTWPPLGSYSFQLEPNQTIDGLSFGNRPEPVGGIHGSKWLDENGDGRRDPNETGLAGWTIRLMSSSGTISSTVTDDFGRYWFMDLAAGTYTLTEVLRSAWDHTWPPLGTYSFQLETNQTIVGLSFGNRPEPVGGIRGAKWLDDNGDGRRNPDESGLPGWTIRLEDGSGTISTMVTDDFGRYSFSNLLARTYTVTELLQTGWESTWPPSGSYSFKLEPGQTVEGLHFGNRLRSSGGSSLRYVSDSGIGVSCIRGTKWHYVDGNGRGNFYESGLAGWTIRLQDSNGLLSTTVTDQNGRYAFRDLPAGTYTVTEVFRIDWERTWPLTDSYRVSLEPDQAIDGLDFSKRPESPGGVYGGKWYDTDSNGRWDEYDLGLAGWTIRLMGSSGVVSTTLTDEGGRYAFNDLPSGTYTLTEILHIGWKQTWQPAGSYIYQFKSGDIIDESDFGNRTEPVDGVHGIKWLDEDGDSQRDQDEPGMAGWTLQVDDGNGISSTTVSGEYGLYHFTDLPAGTFTITELFTPGWEQTFPGPGVRVIDLVIDQTVEWMEFGNWRPLVDGSQIYGMEWDDRNSDGVKDIDEPGLAGWTITINDSSGVTTTTVTNDTGEYWFTELPAGTYTLSEEYQDGWRATFPPSEAHVVNLASSQVSEGLNFGNTVVANRIIYLQLVLTR